MVGVKAFALGIALLRTAAACSCIAQYLTVCEQAQEADVVVFATAVNSSKPTEDIDIDINEDVTFTLEIQTLYQGDVDPKEPLTFTTCGNSACCGIYLEVGHEYLIGLYGDDVDDLYGQSCGLFRGGITEDEKEGIDKELQECEEDPCKRACVADSQECVFFEEEWICGELSCDPSPCADNEYCNVEKWDCTVEPCPTLAFCRDACGGSCGDGEVCVLADEPQCVPDGGEGECNIECGEYQECLLFEWPEYPTYLDEEYTRYAPPGERGDDWWYCADVCAPGRCDDGEVCELLPTPCPGLQIPCPLVAVCYDQCSEGCEADEECVYYPDEGYKCTAPPSCDPNPCPEGEDCAILESFPPIVECTPREDECGGSCLEFQECLIYTGSDGVTEPYCADTCAPGRCDPEGCVLEEVTCVREPCPPVAVCTDGCLDCQEDEVCINYPREGYKCAYQSCDPNPCPEGETCAVQETVPPVVVCYTVEDECGAKCGEFQECMIYTGSNGVEEVYCADVCEPGRCGDEETCSLEEVECVRAPCPPVAQCNPAAGPYEYVDCFRDVRKDRVLGHRISSDDMTTELCMNHCETRGAAYFATQYGKECWCYTTGRTDFDRHENAEDPAECNMPCAGNKDEICGGKWAFSLHKLDWPEPPTDNKEFVGCYRDTRNDRVFTDKLVQADMTPTVCRKHCYYQDALYYGTQYGSECWCGKSISESDYTKHGGGVCHLPCSGDSSIACGGKWAFDLFEIQFDTE